MRLYLSLTLLLSFIFPRVQAQLVLDSDMERKLIGKHVEILNQNSRISFQEILDSTSGNWRPSSDVIVHLDIPHQGQWLKIPVKTQSIETRVLLEISLPTLDTLVAFIPTADGDYEEVELGEHKAFNERMLDYQTFFVPLDFDTPDEYTLYFYVSSSEQTNLPISIGSRTAQLENSVKRDLVFGLYAGVILAMFFYNLFIFFTTRDRSYLYYIAYILFVGMVQTALLGYGFKYLWPTLPQWQSLSLNFLNAGTALFSYLFFSSFIKLYEVLPKWRFPFYFLLALYGVQLVLASIGISHVAYDLMNVSALLLALLFIIVSVIAVFKKVRAASFFLGAWMFFFVSVIIFVLKDVGAIPYNLITANVLQIGSGLEVVLLSFGLADRINSLKKEKEASQLEAFRVLRENENIIREQNVRLEVMVSERTAELNQALVDVKSAQSQLIEQEKLASLGQLTAGIAHEINNPINFVTANVNPLKRDINDVLEVLDAYLKFETGESFERGRAEIEDLIEDIELDYVREEIDKLLVGIEDGAKRTAEIVRGLKIFSRTDEQDLKHLDLIEGLESTLTLLGSSMKGSVKVQRKFEPIPKVECYGGKVNQVFMNILSNAVHAIHAKESGKGVISIDITNTDGMVQVKIADDGPGIKEDKLAHIFDPFFTTKDVGQGTGMGLSIAKGIIEKHNGKIEVYSEINKGATFIITLPVQQPQET